MVTQQAISGLADEITARVYSNVDDEARGVNLSQMPLILYTEVKRGLSPVIDAEVEAMIVAGTHKWSVKLFDNGNGGELSPSFQLNFLFQHKNRTTFLHDFLFSPISPVAFSSILFTRFA